MADLMREIVAEALGRTGRMSGQAAAQGAAGQPGNTGGLPGNAGGLTGNGSGLAGTAAASGTAEAASRTNGSAASHSGTPGTLSRPNWQQAYREKRLQAAGAAGMAPGQAAGGGVAQGDAPGTHGSAWTAPAQAAAAGGGRTLPAWAQPGGDAAHAAAPASGDGGRREFVEQTMSPLLGLMMVQGKTEEEHKSRDFFQDDGGQPMLNCSGMVGRHDDGIRCWFYPDLTPRLAAEFGLHRLQPVTIGVVTSEKGSLRPLFVLEALLADGPADAEVMVRREAGGLEIRLIGKERGWIQSAIERLSLALRQQAGQALRVLTASVPSAMLARALDIPAREAAAVFDGLNRHRSIALLDRAFKAAPELDIRYRIESSHLLIHGAPDAVLEAVRVMKREAGPHLTEE